MTQKDTVPTEPPKLHVIALLPIRFRLVLILAVSVIMAPLSATLGPVSLIFTPVPPANTAAARS